MLKKNKILVFCLKILIFFLAFCFFLNFIFDVKFVKGESMEPTLKQGQVIVICKIFYGIKSLNKNKYRLRWARPKKNDIVVYNINDHFTVKRVVGTDKTPIEFFPSLDYNSRSSTVNAENSYKIFVENNKIDLTAIQFRNLGGFAKKEHQFIPNETVLLLGDNITKSYDSRDYGFVSIDSIYGKVLVWK